MLHINLNGITKFSNMVANYCGCRHLPPPTTLGGWGQKVKNQLFLNMVTLHIKLESNHEFSDMVTNSLPEAPPPYSPPDPEDEAKR